MRKESRKNKFINGQGGFSLVGVMITFSVVAGLLSTYVLKSRNERIRQAREEMFNNSNEIIPALRAAIELDVNGVKGTGRATDYGNGMRCKANKESGKYDISLSEDDKLTKLVSSDGEAIAKLNEYFPGFDLENKCKDRSYDGLCFYSMRAPPVNGEASVRRDMSFFGADFAMVRFIVKFRKANTGKILDSIEGCKKFNDVLVYVTNAYVGSKNCKDEDGNLLQFCIDKIKSTNRGTFGAKATVYYQIYVGIDVGGGKKLVRSSKGIFALGQTVDPTDEIKHQYPPAS